MSQQRKGSRPEGSPSAAETNETFYGPKKQKIMAINYSIAARKNPNPLSEGETKFYAKAQASGEVGIDQLAEEIAYATTLTEADVVGALRALVAQVKKHIQNGQIVRLDSLGSFQVQLSGDGAASEEEYTPALIRKVNLRFRPGRALQTVLTPSAMKFCKVPKLDEPEEEEEQETPQA